VTKFVEFFECDPDGLNCSGPFLEESMNWVEVLLPPWLDVNDPFYQLFVGVSLFCIVTAGIVRIVGKFVFYT
jgi:hypothetical protein